MVYVGVLQYWNSLSQSRLYNLSKALGCNKIALGHHYDDVIVTTLMNMLNSGSFQTMLPKLHSTNYEGMELIRPLYFIREKDIIDFRDQNDLTFIQCACKLTENIDYNNKINSGSKRQDTKELIQELKKVNPDIEKNIFASAENVDVNNILGYKLGDKKYSFLDKISED